MQNELTAADVLDAPVDSNWFTVVRSVAPAVVIVLEKDAPARLEFLRSTEAEEDDLVEWSSRDEVASRVISAYLGDDDLDGERFEREDEYTDRMSSGVVEVTDEIRRSHFLAQVERRGAR